ncbi:MAG: hypothetical protein ABIN01_12875 [Ferruginibacter sp.]
MEFAGITDQSSFLRSLGFKENLRDTISYSGDFIKMVKEELFVTNKLLIEMGDKFKVVIQKRESLIIH